MDAKEKKARKKKLSEYINLSNGRFKDHEIEELESIVENRDNLDGATQTYKSSYRSFDSEDTYRVIESDTYTFHGDDNGVWIDRDWERQWDDGQLDTSHSKYDTGREILNHIHKVLKK